MDKLDETFARTYNFENVNELLFSVGDDSDTIFEKIVKLANLKKTYTDERKLISPEFENSDDPVKLEDLKDKDGFPRSDINVEAELIRRSNISKFTRELNKIMKHLHVLLENYSSSKKNSNSDTNDTENNSGSEKSESHANKSVCVPGPSFANMSNDSSDPPLEKIETDSVAFSRIRRDPSPNVFVEKSELCVINNEEKRFVHTAQSVSFADKIDDEESRKGISVMSVVTSEHLEYGTFKPNLRNITRNDDLVDSIEEIAFDEDEQDSISNEPIITMPSDSEDENTLGRKEQKKLYKLVESDYEPISTQKLPDDLPSYDWIEGNEDFLPLLTQDNFKKTEVDMSTATNPECTGSVDSNEQIESDVPRENADEEESSSDVSIENNIVESNDELKETTSCSTTSLPKENIQSLKKKSDTYTANINIPVTSSDSQYSPTTDTSAPRSSISSGSDYEHELFNALFEREEDRNKLNEKLVLQLNSIRESFEPYFEELREYHKNKKEENEDNINELRISPGHDQKTINEETEFMNAIMNQLHEFINDQHESMDEYSLELQSMISEGIGDILDVVDNTIKFIGMQRERLSYPTRNSMALLNILKLYLNRFIIVIGRAVEHDLMYNSEEQPLLKNGNIICFKDQNINRQYDLLSSTLSNPMNDTEVATGATVTGSQQEVAKLPDLITDNGNKMNSKVTKSESNDSKINTSQLSDDCLNDSVRISRKKHLPVDNGSSSVIESNWQNRDLNIDTKSCLMNKQSKNGRNTSPRSTVNNKSQSYNRPKTLGSGVKVSQPFRVTPVYRRQNATIETPNESNVSPRTRKLSSQNSVSRYQSGSQSHKSGSQEGHQYHELGRQPYKLKFQSYYSTSQSHESGNQSHQSGSQEGHQYHESGRQPYKLKFQSYYSTSQHGTRTNIPSPSAKYNEGSRFQSGFHPRNRLTSNTNSLIPVKQIHRDDKLPSSRRQYIPSESRNIMRNISIERSNSHHSHTKSNGSESDSDS